jgi:arsenate reductase
MENSKAVGNFPEGRSKPERLHSRQLSERSGRNWIPSREKINTEKMKFYDLRQVKQMNIQIFGTKKCNDTKKAERFFKERGIKYQFIDMKEKGMSKGEFTSVAQANGGFENMINWNGKDQDILALIKYIADEDKLEKILENPQVIKTPVVRNGKQSTLGYQPDVWKGWN